MEVAELALSTQSQYIDTQPTSPSSNPVMRGTWLDIHNNTDSYANGMA